MAPEVKAFSRSRSTFARLDIIRLVFDMVCPMTRANLTEQLLCTITTMILTSKAMASVFADEYYSFNGLRNYLSDNIFEVSDFVREILGDINK